MTAPLAPSWDQMAVRQFSAEVRCHRQPQLLAKLLSGEPEQLEELLLPEELPLLARLLVKQREAPQLWLNSRRWQLSKEEP